MSGAFKIFVLCISFITCSAAFAVTDTTEYVPSIRFEIDAGGEIFGYRGELMSQFGRPAAFTFGTRLGQVWGHWTTGFRIGQVTLDDFNFEGEHFFEGRMRPARFEVTQRNTIYSLDVRRDFRARGAIYSFVEGGVSLSRMNMRMSVLDGLVSPQTEEDRHFGSTTVHARNQGLFTLGAGVRLDLTTLLAQPHTDRDSLGGNVFLEFRASYGFGREHSFVQVAENRPDSPQSLLRSPVVTSPADAFFFRLTLGVRIDN